MPNTVTVFSAMLMDYSINRVSLFALIFSIGFLVDNAIVIVENSYRFMEQGASRVEAAMKATSEVAYPVMGSTLTTLAAFSTAALRRSSRTGLTR
mgnify:CR=1 FL=1